MKFGPNNNPEIGADESGEPYAVWDDGFGNKIIKKINE